MFKYMYNDADNNLASKFEAFGLDDTDRIFIEEQISGPIGKGNDVRLLIIYFVDTKYERSYKIKQKLLSDTG